jgi:uncharacterized membrane protein
MGRSQRDIAATALIAVLACGAAAGGAHGAAMAVLGIALFAAPGYLLGQLLVGSQVAGLERVAVMTGLALAVPVIGGLVLYAAGVPLHRPAWVGLLAGTTLASDAALFLRRRVRGSGPVGTAGPASAGRRWPRRVPFWPAIAFAVAVLLAAGGVALARIGVAAQPHAGFTQLWLSSPHGGGQTLDLGVGNDQGRTTSYRLVLRRGGHVVATWNLTLAAGRTWQGSVPLAGPHAVVADLYLLPDTKHPYRYVSTGGRS